MIMKTQKILLSALFLLFGFFGYAQNTLHLTGQIAPVTNPITVNLTYTDNGTTIISSFITDSTGYFNIDTIALLGNQGIVEITFNDCNGTLIGDSGFYATSSPAISAYDFGTIDYCPNGANQTFVSGIFANTSAPVSFSLSLDGNVSYQNFTSSANGTFSESFAGLTGQSEVFISYIDCNGLLHNDSTSNISGSATQEIFSFSNLDFCNTSTQTFATGQLSPVPVSIAPFEIDIIYSNPISTITNTVIMDGTGFFNDTVAINGANYSATASFTDCNGNVVNYSGTYVSPSGSNNGYFDFGILDFCPTSSNTTYFVVEGQFVATTTPINYSVSFNDNGPASYTETSDSLGNIYIDSISVINIPDSIIITYTNCTGSVITATAYAPISLPFPVVFDFGTLVYCNTTPVPCAAGFTLDQNVVIDSLGNIISTGNVLVSNTSVGQNLTYTWDFGDGSPTYTGVNFLHTYAGNGPYLVCLTVSSPATPTAPACTAIFCDSVMVNANGVLSGKTNAGFAIQTGDGSDESTGPNGIDKLETGTSFKMFPNPANRFLTISYHAAQNETAQLVIYNITGKMMIQKEFTYSSSKLENKLDISTLNKGMYIVQFNTTSGFISKTLAVK